MEPSSQSHDSDEADEYIEEDDSYGGYTSINEEVESLA